MNAIVRFIAAGFVLALAASAGAQTATTKPSSSTNGGRAPPAAPSTTQSGPSSQQGLQPSLTPSNSGPVRSPSQATINNLGRSVISNPPVQSRHPCDAINKPSYCKPGHTADGGTQECRSETRCTQLTRQCLDAANLPSYQVVRVNGTLQIVLTPGRTGVTPRTSVDKCSLVLNQCIDGKRCQ